MDGGRGSTVRQAFREGWPEVCGVVSARVRREAEAFLQCGQLRYGFVEVQAVRRKPPLTVDLVFGLTVASSRTAELFNLMGSVATFLNRNRWLELQRDPSAPDRGTVRWELEADGDFRTQLASRDDLRVFTCGFVVRGFDVDEGLPLDRNTMVERPELETEKL